MFGEQTFAQLTTGLRGEGEGGKGGGKGRKREVPVASRLFVFWRQLAISANYHG